MICTWTVVSYFLIKKLIELYLYSQIVVVTREHIYVAMLAILYSCAQEIN